MAIKRRTLTHLLVLAGLVSTLALAETRGKLVAKIHDPEGKGIPGVVVTVTSQNISGYKEVLTTDKKGVFSIEFSRVDVTYHYRFDKPGFQSMEVDQTWHLEGTQTFEWTLHPGESAAVAVGGPPPVSTSQDAVAAYNAGIVALKAKDYATAETRFKESTGHDPSLRLAWVQLASVQVQLAHNKEGAEAAEKAIALGATDHDVLVARWQAYHNLGDEAKAAEALKSLDTIGRRTEEAKKIHNQAVASQKAGDYAGAFTKFQEAVAVDPNLEVAQIGLANAALKLGHNAEAAAAAEAVLRIDPANQNALRIRYNACLALGDKAKLAEALVGLASIEPKIARDGLFRLAYEAYDVNDMTTAADRFAKVIAVDPNFPQPYYWLGVIQVGNGALADAKKNLEHFLQLAPNDPESKSAREMVRELGKS
jgi:tetratricopeptide (TPR) repeat protein